MSKDAAATQSSWFANQSVRTKVMAALAVVSLVSIGVASVSLAALSKTNSRLNSVSNESVSRLQAFSEIRGGLTSLNTGAAEIFAGLWSPDAVSQAPGVKAAILENGNKDVQSGIAQVDTSVAQYAALATSPAFKQQLSIVQQKWPEFRKCTLVYTLHQTPANDGIALPSVTEMGATQAALDNAITQLSSIEKADAIQQAKNNKSAYQNARAGILVALITGLIVAGAIALAVVNAIIRRVRATAEVISQVGSGDLTARVNISGSDEIGTMATSLNSTLQTVHDIVRQIESDSAELANYASTVSAEERFGVKSDDSLTKMANNLSAMTSIFQTQGS